MSTLELLKARHAPAITDQPDVEPASDSTEPANESSELTSWRESETVVALSEFLKASDGTRLVELDGCPCLHFDNSVSPADPEQWQHALTACQLLEAARDDLLYLFELGALQLNPHPGFVR